MQDNITVSELIDILKTYQPDTKVVVGEYRKVDNGFVYQPIIHGYNMDIRMHNLHTPTLADPCWIECDHPRWGPQDRCKKDMGSVLVIKPK